MIKSINTNNVTAVNLDDDAMLSFFSGSCGHYVSLSIVLSEYRELLYLVGLKDRTERIDNYSLKINNFTSY